jgi:hypothetical protein
MPENASLPASAVRIARLNVSYLLSGRHPSPAAVRARLDSLLERQLPSACVSSLGPLCPDSDPSIWFIRRLDVNLTADADADGENGQIPRAWSEALARILQRALSNGDLRDDVLRFPHPAAYLAQFLRDLAGGVAWSKWYYDGFNGLRALPVNAALREALCREPATGEAALRQLANDGRFEKVLRALTEADCRTVLKALCGTADNAAAPDATTSYLRAALRAWQNTGRLTAEPAVRYHTALQLYLAMRDGDAAPSPALLLAIHALLWLARWTTSSQAGPLLAALQRGDTATAFALVSGDDVEALTTLLRCDRATVTDIAEQLRAAATGGAHAAGVQTGEPRITSFGGAFWLLPRIDDLKLEGCAAALPDFEGKALAALLRFLILLKCLGARRAPRAFFDPMLREVARVSPDLSVQDVRAWAREVTPEMTDDFQARWMTLCRRQGLISSRWLSVRPARRGRLLLLADGERNIYLRATRSINQLMSALEEEQQVEHCADAVLCDPALAAMLPATVSGMPVYAWNSSEAAAWATEDPSLTACLERARPPDDDLTYMNLASLLRRSARHLDLALSLAARGVLGAFAWRLPGFAWSSADFLYTNFLDVTATVEPGAEHWLVRLTRPPLHIVLAMTGAAHDTYHVSWLGGRRVQLTRSES